MTESPKILAKAVGRRKTAVAQVQILTGTGQFIINNKPAQVYLQNNSSSILEIKAPFEVFQNTLSTLSNPSEELEAGKSPTFDTFVKVEGGGLLGQAQAIKLAIARAILEMEIKKTTDISFLTSDSDNVIKEQSENFIRKAFKRNGYLTSDSRAKERRKYGLKKARKASQYHKR